MAKQVSLSDRAYTHLRAQKKSGESFSDVVERLIELAGHKDPWHFVGRRNAIPAKEHHELVQRLRDEERA